METQKSHMKIKILICFNSLLKQKQLNKILVQKIVSENIYKFKHAFRKKNQSNNPNTNFFSFTVFVFLSLAKRWLLAGKHGGVKNEHQIY